MPYQAKQIRGKTVKEWAKHLGITISAVYSLIHRGNLESRIDGTYKRKFKPYKLYEGKTSQEWAKQFGVCIARVYYFAKLGVLRDIESGAYIMGNTKHLVRGKTLTYWAKQLGITKERARQLSNQGLLEDRIDGKTHIKDQSYLVEKRRIREEAVKSYNPKEKLRSFAKRHNIALTTAYSWLRSAGIKHITSVEQMKIQKYRRKAAKNKCKTCKYFMRKETHYHWCSLGGFSMTRQSGTCKYYRVFVPAVPVFSITGT